MEHALRFFALVSFVFLCLCLWSERKRPFHLWLGYSLGATSVFMVIVAFLLGMLLAVKWALGL